MTHFNKPNLLFVIIGGFFVANAMIAEFVGVKVFSVEKTLGFEFGPALNLSAGALLWPLEFAIADLINEYFGKKGIRILSYLTVSLIGYAFLIILMAMYLVPADIWIIRETAHGPVNMVLAFDAVFSQGLWIIIGSMIAFLIGQLIDVMIFYKVKQYTGEKHLWLRATGSTFVSQLIDSFIVLIIAFHLNPATQWGLNEVLAMGVIKYFYKLLMAIALTPLIYLLHYLIDRYLGEELAMQMKSQAMQDSQSEKEGTTSSVDKSTKPE